MKLSSAVTIIFAHAFCSMVHAQPLAIEISYDTSMPIASIEQVNKKEHACLNEAIYWEGRNQEIDGMVAIGSVILNRVASDDFPDSVCEVVHQGPLDGSAISLHRCQFSYYCDGLSDSPPESNPIELEAWTWADVIAESLLLSDIQDNTGGSTYYHAHYVDPFWNDVYFHSTTVDDHLFYIHAW